ncbi:hypothetical protein [Amycolatopsis sp. NPDC001319]|uniref:hypothetical protein n=1 Tax=unclassified Amycolatopsis TaxID=2618356 RepID=UPI0036964552
MMTQRTGNPYIPAADVQAVALFYAAAGLTLICAGLAIASAAAGSNASAGRRRCRHAEMDRSINDIEQMLSER